MEKISTIIKEMIDYSHGNLHDINHFMKVYGYAITIASLEDVDEKTFYIIQVSAILHDIACPLCRQKYGHTAGYLQEKEGRILAREFLKDKDIPQEVQESIIDIIATHHSYELEKSLALQIVMEADFIVNANESHLDKKAILTFREKIFKTTAGIDLLNSIYCL